MAALVANRISNVDIADLRTCINMMEREFEKDHHEEFEKADRKFHELLAVAIGNKVLNQFVMLLRAPDQAVCCATVGYWSL